MSYDHLKVFGCKAFVHIPKDERSKLDVKTRQCIFLGYGQDEFGYKLYDLVGKKVVRSHDIMFMEYQTFQDIDKAEQAVTKSYDDMVDVEPIQVAPVNVPDEQEI